MQSLDDCGGFRDREDRSLRGALVQDLQVSIVTCRSNKWSRTMQATQSLIAVAAEDSISAIRGPVRQ